MEGKRMDAVLGVFFRWLHIIPACLSIGGAFFMPVLLPIGLSVLPPDQPKAVFLKCRRGFKMVVHPSILLLLVSGTYNLMGNRARYHQAMPQSHMLLGIHVLLGLAVFTI